MKWNPSVYLRQSWGCLGMVLALVACEPVEEAKEAAAGEGAATLKTLILEQKPDAALSVTEARKQPEVGNEITVSGKIMGRMKPLAEGRAMFLIGDPDKLVSCDLLPDDHCQTPWDLCCASPEAIKAATATVQVKDASGGLLKQSLRGVGGIQELSEVVVRGWVDPASNEDILIINASGIYVRPDNTNVPATEPKPLGTGVSRINTKR